MTNNRAALLAAISTALISFSAHAQSAQTTPPPMPRRPSIILIVADGLGYGDLGCYGQDAVKTPRIDKMAASGIRFTDFYTGSPNTDTALASILTGRDSTHLAPDTNSPATLPVGAPTFAEILHQAGYHTGCVGEWLLAQDGSVNIPAKRGFQEWAGLLTDADARTDYPSTISRYDPPGDGKPGYDGKVQFAQNDNGAKGKSFADITTTAAINFLTYNKPDQFNKRRPYFLLLNYALPRVHDFDTPTPYELEPWPRAEKFRASAIARLDTCVGKILDALKSTRQDSNTIVLLTSSGAPRTEAGSDPQFHHSLGRFRGAGGDLQEGGLRVPLIISGPDNVKSGEENYSPCAAWDLFATFTEIARAKNPDDVDGLSLLPILHGKALLSGHENLLWENRPGGALAVRHGEWKALRPAPGQPWQLYNLQSDPRESTDLAADHADVLAQIELRLKPPAPRKIPPTIDRVNK